MTMLNMNNRIAMDVSDFIIPCSLLESPKFFFFSRCGYEMKKRTDPPSGMVIFSLLYFTVSKFKDKRAYFINGDVEQFFPLFR